MNPLIIWAVRASLLLLKVKDGPLDDKLKAELDDLRAQLTPQLPAPPNGVEWTTEDLQALAQQVKDVNAEIRLAHGDGTGEP